MLINEWIGWIVKYRKVKEFPGKPEKVRIGNRKPWKVTSDMHLVSVINQGVSDLAYVEDSADFRRIDAKDENILKILQFWQFFYK